MAYYEENSWSRDYILQASKIVTETWEIYKNASEVESSDILEDDLLSHVFKKRKTEHKDELKSYLNDVTMPVKTNVLKWWKVNFNKIV